MTIHASPLSALLADLAEHGIDLEPCGGRLRYRPRNAMLPDLLSRLQDQKAELLAWMDLDELRRFISLVWRDQGWIMAWKRRLQAAKYANLDTLRRVLALILELAEQHHRQRDWRAFDGTVTYLHRFASGEEWDKTAQTRPI